MRLFIAVEIPGSIHEALKELINKLKQIDDKNVKWVKTESTHLTLKFLGEVEETKLDKIVSTLKTVRFEKESVFISKLGCFPALSNPRVIWAGIFPVNSSDLKIVKLANNIDKVMHTLKFEKEKRKFNAHLTLGRAKDKVSDVLKDYIKNNSDIIKLGEFEYKLFTLFKSTLKPTGAEYTIIEKFCSVEI